jgi:hypothetical protein
MRRYVFKQLVLGLVCGGVLFQAASCTDIATQVTAVATAVTAGGVLWIIRRINSD